MVSFAKLYLKYQQYLKIESTHSHCGSLPAEWKGEPLSQWCSGRLPYLVDLALCQPVGQNDRQKKTGRQKGKQIVIQTNKYTNRKQKTKNRAGVLRQTEILSWGGRRRKSEVHPHHNAYTVARAHTHTQNFTICLSHFLSHTTHAVLLCLTTDSSDTETPPDLT